MKERFTKFFCIITVLTIFAVVAEPVYATTISDLQREKENNEAHLKDINKQISDYKGAQADIGEEIEELDAEMVSLLTDINLIEEEIVKKEDEIQVTQTDYEAAVATKDEQYESMKIRIKFMYEQGDVSYLQMFLEASSMNDMINKAEYVEKLYEYDRKLLDEYQETVEAVAALQDRLEEEKSELQTSKYELEEEQAYVKEILAKKQEEYENYDVILAKARQQAAAYTTKIKQETAQIKKLEEEEARKKAEEEARKKAEEEELLAKSKNSDNNNGGNDSSEQPKPAPSATGSAKGQEIANYACKWIGNPYKAGGTSLTDGADCSGFVWAVYNACGYSLPRSSYAQSACGKGVAYSDAQPGDVIYYGGHVGIYIGNGQIVHASTERTGIKISSATYRSIITVRRIV